GPINGVHRMLRMFEDPFPTAPPPPPSPIAIAIATEEEQEKAAGKESERLGSLVRASACGVALASPSIFGMNFAVSKV
ncbi:Os08g0484100, partial [Oryza sativa Japonica Group]